MPCNVDNKTFKQLVAMYLRYIYNQINVIFPFVFFSKLSGEKERILSSGFSQSGKWFATCDDWKQLTLWETGSIWTRKSVR